MFKFLIGLILLPLMLVSGASAQACGYGVGVAYTPTYSFAAFTFAAPVAVQTYATAAYVPTVLQYPAVPVAQAAPVADPAPVCATPVLAAPAPVLAAPVYTAQLFGVPYTTGFYTRVNRFGYGFGVNRFGVDVVRVHRPLVVRSRVAVNVRGAGVRVRVGRFGHVRVR